MRRLWARGAEPSQPFLEPERILHEPSGNIDGPEPGSTIRRAIHIWGWALFPDTPTAKVEIILAGHPLGQARLGHPRPDVKAHWDLDLGGSSGFDLTTSLAELDLPKGEAELEVVATSLEGERLRLDPITVELDLERKTKPAPLPPPPLHTPLQSSRTRPHVLVVTHQLNLGGAQLYLLDLIKEMVRDDLASFTFMSTMDGSLREDIEGLGIPVHISGLTPTDDLSSYIGRLEELCSWMADRDFDAAIVNTATTATVAGAEAAEAMGLPLLWAIHESFPPVLLWGEDIAPEVEARIIGTLAGAAALIFEATATQRIYEPLAGPEPCMTIPYGLDLEPIDAARRKLDLTAARRKAKIPEDAELIVCIGTIEPRKAQLMLAQAFDIIAPRHPSAHLAFVGARDDLDSEILADYVASCDAEERIELIEVTPDVDVWYAMADLLVCASDVESLPRTVLEAMAWETPVLATNVFGLPELITDGETGWLCEPRDLGALVEGLEHALSSSPKERRRIAERARALVENRHSLPKYAQVVSGILEEAIMNNRRSVKEAETG
jgi:glycosyltransferase involved in cell wall biosynthesis